MSMLDQKDFLKRQINAIDNAPRPSTSHTTYVPVSERQKVTKKPAIKTQQKQDPEAAKASAFNAANFSTLARIVNFMKERHLNQKNWSLTLNEVLDEMQLDSLSSKSIAWLQEALPENPRLSAQLDNNVMKYIYKPPHKIKTRAALIALFKKYHTDGKGALLLSELSDCISNAAKVVETLGSVVIDIPTQANKRRDHAYFFNDPNTDYSIKDDFLTLWNSINVEHIDDNKIAEYLQKHGITSVKELAPHRVAGVPKRKAPRKRANVKTHNLHLEDTLINFAQ